MTNPVYSQNQQPPAYTGVSINITNPTMTVLPDGTPVQMSANSVYNSQSNSSNTAVPAVSVVGSDGSAAYVSNPNCTCNNPQCNSGQNQQYYPPQYYMNNYNYLPSGGSYGGAFPENIASINGNGEVYNSGQAGRNENSTETSENIINDIDARAAEQKEMEKNAKQTKIIALTNEYIMSLENYLNNPNKEIRMMAAKEILTRFDEDKTRRDDAALNALLNKMLQDPEKLIRILALSALSSDLAMGNEYTFQLLNQIQQNPNADPEDVLEISQILLNRSSTPEIRYVPVQNNIEIADNN